MELITNPGDIHLRDQDDIQEILGHPPGWLLYWGISLVLLGVLVLGIVAWMVKYPDTIEARVMLTTENPPLRVVAHQDGELRELLVENNEEVEAGQLLAEIENPALRESILELETYLKTVESSTDFSALRTVLLPQNLNLGTLQNTWSVLRERIRSLDYFVEQDNARQKKIALSRQIEELKALNDALKKQEQTLGEELIIATRSYERNQQLRQEKLNAEIDVEQSRTRQLRTRRQLEDLQTSIINNRLRIEQIRVEMLNLEQNENGVLSEKWLSLREDIQRLQSEIRQWKEDFLLIAPIAGKVSFPESRTAKQFVRAGEEILTLVPQHSAGGIVGQVQLPVSGAGKVQEGMRINIRLDGFPYQEFGSLQAKVEKIAPVPQDGFYLLEFGLPDTLLTSYKRYIPFRQEMQGSADIITEDRSILDRVFDRFRSAVYNR